MNISGARANIDGTRNAGSAFEDTFRPNPSSDTLNRSAGPMRAYVLVDVAGGAFRSEGIRAL